MPTPTLYKLIESELHKRTPSEMVDENGDLVFFDKQHQIMPKILKFDGDVYDIMNQLFNGLELESDEYDYHFKKTFLFRFINRKINRQTIEAFQFELMNVFLTSEGYINRVYRDAEKFILQHAETEGTSKELSNEISKIVNEQLTEQLDKRETEDRNRTDSRDTTANESRDTSTQESNQKADTDTETDTATGRSDLPQNTVDLNLDNRNMRTANEFEKNRNKTSDSRNTDTTTETVNESENSGTSTGESTGESSGTATGETSTDTKGQTDSERDATRDGRTSGMSIQYILDELFKSGGLMEGIFNNFDRKCFMQTW